MGGPAHQHGSLPSTVRRSLLRLMALLKEQTAESAQLDKRIAGILKELGRGL